MKIKKIDSKVVFSFFAVIIMISSAVFVQASYGTANKEIIENDITNKYYTDMEDIDFSTLSYHQLISFLEKALIKIGNYQLLDYLHQFDEQFRYVCNGNYEEVFSIIRNYFEDEIMEIDFRNQTLQKTLTTNIRYINEIFSIKNEIGKKLENNPSSAKISESTEEFLNKLKDALEKKTVESNDYSTDFEYYWDYYCKVREYMDGYGGYPNCDLYEDWFRYAHKWLFGVTIDEKKFVPNQWFITDWTGIIGGFSIVLIVVSMIANLKSHDGTNILQLGKYLALSNLANFGLLTSFALFAVKVTLFTTIKECYDALWTKEIDILLRIKRERLPYEKESANLWLHNRSLKIFAYNIEIPDNYQEAFPNEGENDWEEKFKHSLHYAFNITESGWYALSSIPTMNRENSYERPQPPFPPGFYNITIEGQKIYTGKGKEPDEWENESETFLFEKKYIPEHEIPELFNCGIYLNKSITLKRNWTGYPIIHDSIPTNDSTNYHSEPHLSVNISDEDERFKMNVTFYSNESTDIPYNWELIGWNKNDYIPGNQQRFWFNDTQDRFNEPGKTYYWYVNATDSDGNTRPSEIFSFVVR